MNDNKQREPPRTNEEPNNAIMTETPQIGHKLDKQPWSNKLNQLNFHPR
jgi:hypothetical protein